MPNSFRYQEPIIDVSPVNLGKPVSVEFPLGKTLVNAILSVAITGSATGAATKTIPRPSWGLGEMRFKLGNVNITRTAKDLYGIGGLLALNDVKQAGMVQYRQGGNLVTVAYGGRTIGNEPVLIDSLEDVALQAALANNTATVAEFTLPFPFAEDWRNDPAYAGEGMALPTGFDDGSVLGTPYLEIDTPAATGVAGTMTGVTVGASLVYTEARAKAGSVIRMVKKKVHQKNYSVGEINLGNEFDTKDVLMRFSLLTAADKISKVIVKQGSRILRSVTFAENHVANAVSGINGAAARSNRFDIELDQSDDPNTGRPLSRTEKLEVLATFATANDNPASCLILADYYGPVE
jgi:hypothetical protein